MKPKKTHFEVPISLGTAVGAGERLLQEAPVLPVQFFDQPGLEQPEKRLLGAVLEDALYCWQKGRNNSGSARTNSLSREAEEWLLSGENHWPFSFNVICHRLGFNADLIRSQIASGTWRYVRAQGNSMRGGRSCIAPLTLAQRMGKKLAKESTLRSVLWVEPLRIAEILREVRKEGKWKEVYNLVFGFLFFNLCNPPQTATQIAHHLKCGQAYANNKVRDRFCRAIIARDPLFEDALCRIAARCGINIRVLGTLLSRLR